MTTLSCRQAHRRLRIEAAYETIKRRLNGHSDEMLVRLIHKAYIVLADPEQRDAYDEALEREAQRGRRGTQGITSIRRLPRDRVGYRTFPRRSMWH